MKRISLLLFLLPIAAYAQFGNATRIWGRPIVSTAPTDGQGYVWNASNNRWQLATGSGTGTVTSAVIAGTANQITVSGTCTITTTGTCTLSIASGFIFPGAATFQAGTTSISSFRMPSGVAKTTPVSGDFWNLSGVIQYYDGTNVRSIQASDPSASGAVVMSGLTSGAAGFAVDDVAGAAILYLLPATNTAANQLWYDTGAATCPTLASGAPGTCHQFGNKTLDDALLTLTDVTTNNASASKHGFLLKLDNNAAHYMNGQGAWTTPAGGGSGCIPAGTATQILLDDGAGGCTAAAPTYASGIFTAANFVSGNNFTVGSGAAFATTAGSSLISPSDGVWKMLNNAQTDFGRLCFGPCTSSFPSVKRSGTGLIVRLADDSANAPFTASTVTASSSLDVGGSNFTVTSGGVPSKVGGVTTVGLGVPVIGWESNVTSQSSSQSTVTLATAPGAGKYKLSYSADLTTPCTTGNNTVSFSFSWTAGGSRTYTTGSLFMGAAQATTGSIGEVLPIQVASGNVTYTSTVLGSCSSGTSAYNVYVWLERVK